MNVPCSWRFVEGTGVVMKNQLIGVGGTLVIASPWTFSVKLLTTRFPINLDSQSCVDATQPRAKGPTFLRY